MCFDRPAVVPNAWPQIPHVNPDAAASPPCTWAICLSNCDFWAYTLPQTSHGNVLKSPTLCTRAICFSQYIFVLNALSQMSHLKSATSPCRWTTDKCVFNAPFWLNFREQRSHWKVRASPIPCAFALWRLRFRFSKYFLPQTSHSWFPVPRSALRLRVGWPCAVS